MIRPACMSDAQQIIELEKKYYDSYFVSEEILTKWIENGNFFILERDSQIIGSIYFEFLNEIKDLPWYHKPIQGIGDYVYISEIATNSPDNINLLFDEVLKAAKEKNCKGIVWGMNHDKIEREFLQSNGFIKFQEVKDWECSPNYFIHDHALWLRKL